jgi:thiol:disulfide interchange protein DsbD
MESAVWSKPEILKALSEKFVIIALYTDDRTALPENEWQKSKFDGKTYKTIGQINANFQIEKYNMNSQPYYVKLDTAENIIGNPIGMELNKEVFLNWLNE